MGVVREMASKAYVTTLVRLLTDTVGRSSSTTVPLVEALGRRLASDLITHHPSPRFDNSQMDGYGITYANLTGGRFRVGPDVPAGTDPVGIYPHGVSGDGNDIAAPIMTGAAIPEDVAAIIPVEHADPATFVEVDHYVNLPATEAGKFIRKAGSDMKVGTHLAREGTVIDAALIATAASQGITELSVTSRLRVGIIAGGDEVVSSNTPAPAKIFDANTPLLRNLAQAHGLEVVATAGTTDDLHDFQIALDHMLHDQGPDLIITSGGISEGKYEVVRQFLDRLDTAWVGKIDQQPGGPQGYGVYGSTPIIAVPGNPVSTMVSMRMLILPAVWQAFNTGFEPVQILARINDAVSGIQNKTQYRRGVVGLHGTEVVAEIQGETGSHLLAQAVGANALIEIPPEARLQPGDTVAAHLYANTSWNATVAPVPIRAARFESEPNGHSGSRERTALVVVSSTRAAAGIYEDNAGPKLVEWLQTKGYDVPEALVVADHDLKTTMQRLISGEYGPLPDVLITSGGTGVSPTDQTVEILSEYLDVQMPHVTSALLLKGLKSTPHAALSRGIAGLMGTTFVVTLPGSIGGVKDGIAVLDELIDHIVDQVQGMDHSR